MLPAQARLRRRPEFTTVIRSGRRAGRPTMVLHYLADRPSRPGNEGGADRVQSAGARAGFVVGRSVGNSVVRHRVTRRLRALVAAELHRLPASADLVVRAQPQAAEATSDLLRVDLTAGLARLLTDRARVR